jgi:hypothetical protein
MLRSLKRCMWLVVPDMRSQAAPRLARTEKKATLRRRQRAEKKANGENHSRRGRHSGGSGGSPPGLILRETTASGPKAREQATPSAWGYVDLNHGPLPYQGADLAA